MKIYVKAATRDFKYDRRNDDLASVIKKADVKNPIARRKEIKNNPYYPNWNNPYYQGLDLCLWDGDSEVVYGNLDYHIPVPTIPEGLSVHNADLTLTYIGRTWGDIIKTFGVMPKHSTDINIFEDSNGQVYYYPVGQHSRIMQVLSKGETYNLSCKVMDIPEGVASNGLTYDFKCSWITYINPKSLKAELKELADEDARIMQLFYGPNRSEIFDENLVK